MSCMLIPASRPSGIRLLPEDLLPLMVDRDRLISVPPIIISVMPAASSRAIMPVYALPSVVTTSYAMY